MSDSFSKYYPAENMLHGAIEPIMGTRLDVILLGINFNNLDSCWKYIVVEVNRLSELFNKFDYNSELAYINRQAKRAKVSVSDELWLVLTECKRYHKLTKGYFDISQKNYDKVKLFEDSRSVFFADKLQLDLGAYAKGYTLEKVRLILQNHQIESALINFGNSSVLGLGTHPYGDCWSIDIPNPFDQENVIGNTNLKNETLSVSGNTPKHSKHIINPFTGEYFKSKKIAVIKTLNAIDAEVLSTTLLLADAEEMKQIQANFKIIESSIYRI